MGVGTQCHSLATLPQKRNQVPIVLGGTQGWSGQLQKISCKPGFKTQTVQLVLSHFLCRQYGSLEEKREKREKSDRQHTVSPGFQVSFPDQTVTHTHTFSLWRWMGVAAQCHSLATQPQESGTHCIKWEIGLVWTSAENLVQAGIQSPDSPACSESLYQLSYPNPHNS